MVLFVLMVGLPLTSEAHPSCPRRYRRAAKRTYVSRSYVTRRSYVNRSYDAPRYYRTAGYAVNRPSFYRRHRNLINVGIATGGGALIGGIARGKRGAGVGALSGAGIGALYTYVLNKKRRRY